MSKVKKDACSLEILFTGDDYDPDTGLKKCDFSLVIKGSRTVPVDTVALLSLQSRDGIFNSDKEIGVAIRRAQQTIKASRLERKYCIAGVTSGIIVQWFLVERCDDDEFTFIQSPEYDFRRSLCAILKSTPEKLYYCKLDPVEVNGKQLIFYKLIGFGGTSKVYDACQYAGQDVATKVYNNVFDSEYEANVLEKLKDASNIPTVVATGLGILIMKEIGHGLKYGSVLDPKHGEKICDIVDTLEAVHRLGYVHRDVRIPNLLKVKQEGKAGMMLIDWGFAARSGIPFAFAGNFLTASDDVSDQLESKLHSTTMQPPEKKLKIVTRSTSTVSNLWYEDSSSLQVTFEPKDDLISLVCSLYFLTKRHMAYEGGETNCQDIKEFWFNQFGNNSTFLRGQ